MDDTQDVLVNDTAYGTLTAAYTNTAPGGVAYRCSFRVTEAVSLIERMVKVLADELEMDPAEIRRKNFIQPDQFPYESPTGWNYDSDDSADAPSVTHEGTTDHFCCHGRADSFRTDPDDYLDAVEDEELTP
ncbi:molybdopterin cofactor-binding domain-containing protein [Natronorubrum sp. FCH18a]|uniref:molybdopterin cofactor-binding domain-containing protein n=1 Tax=Natronorubrum sp. FCH18a TaxID=3447018 RepID=UPI003F50E861